LNYGSATTLRADGSPVYRSYLRFNVGDLGGVVTNATLRLYTTSASATGYQVKRVNNPSWEENTITYDNSPAAGSTIGSSGSIAVGSWTSVDVTALITGNGIYDLALTTTTSAALNFNSRNASSNQPQLVIETSATGGATATPSSAPTATRTPTGMPTVAATTSSANVTFTTVADARVVLTSPTTNYGTSTTLLADGGSSAQTSYIRFNTSGISNPIANVKLRVFCTTNGSPNGPAVYLADNNWMESGAGGITWNNQPALLSGVIDNKGAIGTNSWVEYDVTSLVLGNGTYTFALVADGNDGVTFSSREGASDPQLVVTLGTDVPPASPTQTRTPTQTNPPATTNTPTFTPTSTQTNPPAVTDTPTATQTPTATATVSSGTTITYTTEADTRVSQSSPATNYGSQSNLLISGADGSAQTGYIRFTVNGINGSVQSVRLRVFCTTNGTIDGPAVYLADDAWIEKGTGGITWDTQPALLSGVLDNKGAIGTNVWVEYDVTALVTGDGTYTFALLGDGDDGVTFSSREGNAPPQLVVTFGP
jgi:hypothetical protein